MEKPTLLMILGLGHSGTTILDLALGSADGVVGVGEGLRMLDDSISKGGDDAWQLLRENRLGEVTCSCGEIGSACPVWSQGRDFLKPDSFADRADRLLSAAASTSPGTRLVIDSTPGGQRYLRHLEHHSVKILHAVRDMRSWTRSEVNRRKISSLRAYAKWSRTTKRMAQELSEFGSDYFRIGYEEFALNPVGTLQSLCAWLELDYRSEMLEPAKNTKSHVISGNPFLRRTGQAAQITYDGKWLSNSDARFSDALAFALLANRNRQLVYGNGLIGQ
ncbi:MAG: sulfotransferase [Pseudomonadota bacterium]